MVDITQNDSGFTMTFTVTDTASNAVDLTGGTVQFRTRLPGASATVNSSCALLVATDGTCTYTAQATDFATTGTYYFEVEFVSSDNQIITAPGEEVIKVVEEIA